ncbi:MAG: type II secretion system protein [Colwellia sp.]|nr:type II secretion system protein [Colwellia sp.]
MFNNKWAKSLTQKFNAIQASDIADTELKSKFLKLKAAKQAGFTLLELLVVVAILAAIAGTASIALQDTDARASAAAHVTMMDELNKGIRTYRVLNKNELPNNFDSLLEKVDGPTAAAAGAFAGGALGTPTSVLGFEDSLATITLNDGMAGILNDGGITDLRYIQNDLVVDGAGSCTSANLATTIGSRGNAVVANNIFMGPAANGCGASVAVWDDTANSGAGGSSNQTVAIWTGGFERVMGSAGAGFDATALTVAANAITAGTQNAPILMAVGIGPSSNLFNANEVGGMTTVPVYRHVSELQYGRFVALFEIGEWDLANTSMDAADQVVLTAIIDGAGDTKEEELGEWDGTRNTI